MNRSSIITGARPRSTMTEPAATGYNDSPDTADTAAGLEDGQQQGSGPDAPLTTDDDAQRDDLPARPGNDAG
jgi:hypothetical protein